MAGPGESSTKMQKALQEQIPAELASLAAARRKVAGLAGKDSFTPSLRDHLLHEIDLTAALGERYVDYVESIPAAATDRDLFRNGFSGGLTIPGGSVSNAPAERTVVSQELLTDGLSGLVEAADSGQGDLPAAGDIYREIILRLFVPHTSDDADARSLAVSEQLYWLWHIREIEDTPDEAFDNTRLTTKLQLQGPEGGALVSVDSRFDELAAITVVMANAINDPKQWAPNTPWIVELLDRPFPDALAEAVDLARQAAALIPEDGSPASPELIEIGPKLVPTLAQAADDLDQTAQFRKDFRAAIVGTRPASTA